MKTLNILFTSVGRRFELINCFREDAKTLGISLRVLAVDLHPDMSAACQASDRSWKICRCTDSDYVEKLLELCHDESVDMLVPTIDTELSVLSDAASRFAEIGTRVAISSPDVIQIARDKLLTARFLLSHGLPVPKTAPLKDFSKDIFAWNWPVLLKPVDGSCSKGIFLLKNQCDLKGLPQLKGNYIAQECKKGREYTVNFFMDMNGKFRCAVPHIRLETRAGEVSKAITSRHEKLMKMAEDFAGIFPGGRSAMCFQLIEDDEGIWIFELNARFGGGYPIAHRAGARYSLWLLEEITGRGPSYSNEWLEGLKMLRYDAALFV